MTTKREGEAQRLRERIAHERAWIERCGGSLQGYIERYGSYHDVVHSGEGGEIIYASDLARLHNYVAQLRLVEQG